MEYLINKKLQKIETEIKQCILLAETDLDAAREANYTADIVEHQHRINSLNDLIKMAESCYK